MTEQVDDGGALALDKHEFPCSECGAKLEFKPGAQKLECPYCGHSQAIAKKGDSYVAEYSFENALREARTRPPSELITGGQEVRCTGCGAHTVITGQAARCAFCDAPVVVHQSAEKVIVPESVLPFKLDAKEAKTKFKDWVSSRWFAPSSLKARSELAGMDGVYLPYWTYDSETDTRYSGARGTHYYETESYRDSNGNTQTRRVQKTRWSNTSGWVHVSFDDVLVCGSSALPRPLAEKLEPWDLHDLTGYEPSYLSGFLAERYGVDLQSGFHIAEERMTPEIRSAICRDIGGDAQRVYSMDVAHRQVKWKHFLLPLWISSYRYGDKVYRFLVNARTGQAAGERPYSAIKIALASIAGLIVAYLLFLLYQSLERGS
jgi:DNA-directed RNA polymerase subunit RPC12/RpoP